jgi:hypothetical protein
MKSFVSKLLIGLAGLALASAPLAASAQNSDAHGHDNGGYRSNGDRGRDAGRGGFVRGGNGYRVGYAQPAYQRPNYAQSYVNGYFGFAPGGFQGYFWNGGWYHHRRWNGGVWIYF